MEIKKRTIRQPFGSQMNLYFLGDIHEGNCNTNIKALQEAVEIIKNDENGYWIGLGDYIEAITNTGDPRFNPVELSRKYNLKDLTDLPRKQIQVVYENLLPIRNKCLALVIGNHEEAYIKHNNFDIYDYFANLMGRDLKIGYVGFVKLGIIYENDRDRPNYTIDVALNHGVGGGGKREGYPTNKVHDLFRWFDAEINVCGHLHKLVSNQQLFYSTTQSDKLKKTWHHYGCSGCFLETQVEGNTNYFDHKGKPASDIGMLKAEIKIKKRPQIKLKKVYL